MCLRTHFSITTTTTEERSMTEQRIEDFRIGSWERPDPAGIVRRGAAAEDVRRYVERFGEGDPACYVGARPGRACDRPAVMEVYGLPMCEIHGEEAASGALKEIAFDLEEELQRPMHPYVRDLSPHLERALRHGFETVPEEAYDHERDEALLLAAFPLDRSRVTSEVLAEAEEPEEERGRESYHEAFMHHRLLVCRHMRLAFEEGADWLVEVLEGKRADIAAQAAYALALERGS